MEDTAAFGSQRKDLQQERDAGTLVIDQQELEERRLYDKSSREPVLGWLTSSIVWLLLGSLFGIIASVKLHLPDWRVSEPVLTFGRIRPGHLNVVAYG